MSLVRRTFRAALALALPACTAWQRAPNDARDRPLRVMTYNIHAGHGDIARTAAAIRASAPDMVALQEVDVHWSERSGFVDQASALAATLGMEVRFAHIYNVLSAETSKPPREFGVALLSRHRIVTWRNDSLTRLSTQDSNPVPKVAPGLLEAMVEVNGLQIRVFNTHLDYRADPGVRRQQAKEMVAVIAGSRQPTIVFGDLNATPDAGELAPLLSTLADAWPSNAGPGYTYPAEQPTKRIDYVLISRDFRVAAATVPVSDASDHRPVVVDLIVPR